jgi:hypothetical protein
LAMILTTWAWVPPSWATMLPQKFSAAATRTMRLATAADPPVVAGTVVAQPLRARVVASTRTATTCVGLVAGDDQLPST